MSENWSSWVFREYIFFILLNIYKNFYHINNLHNLIILKINFSFSILLSIHSWPYKKIQMFLWKRRTWTRYGIKIESCIYKRKNIFIFNFTFLQDSSSRFGGLFWLSKWLSDQRWKEVMSLCSPSKILSRTGITNIFERNDRRSDSDSSHK